MKGVNVLTTNEVMLYSNDSESTMKSKHDINSRMNANEKFWAIKIGEHKKLLDIQHKPIETYIDEDILNVLGYLKRRPTGDLANTEKTFHNEYHKRKRHIYCTQVYLPKEEYLVMQNFDIYTLVKKRPIDELFSILYIAQVTNESMIQEINTFIDDHGLNETCCMLLQIISNPQDAYLISVGIVSKTQKLNNKKLANKYAFSPISKYEEQKGYDSEDEDTKENEKGSASCEFKTSSENIIDFAKSIFFRIGNTLPRHPTARDFSSILTTERTTLLHDMKKADNIVQTVKLSSLQVYLSRILQPIFKNFLVFITSLKKNAEYFPNMGVSEKRVVGSKLKNLLSFVKKEEKHLIKFPRDERETRDTHRDRESRHYDISPNYESLMQHESQQVEYLKVFITRCIIAIDFIEEVGASSDDFKEAVKRMTTEDREELEKYSFFELTQEISNESAFKNFVKKLLEVKTEVCIDIKEAKRVCEHWNRKCGVYVDKEFILVFIAEYQINRMIEAKRADDEILMASLREMSNYPMQFEVDRVVYMLIRLHKLKELVKLLCVRFLFIQEYQEQENTFSGTRDRVIKIDHNYYKTQENL